MLAAERARKLRTNKAFVMRIPQALPRGSFHQLGLHIFKHYIFYRKDMIIGGFSKS